MIKYNSFSKLLIFFKLILIFIAFFSKSYADTNLIVLGTNDAPIKIKIFSSLTCPHCANFHKEVVSKIKKDYVESGKVQLIFIDFPLDRAAFNASKLLHCLEQKKQLAFLDKIYESQDQWMSGTDLNEINNNLKKIAKFSGINSIQFDKCINDEIIGDKILEGRIEGQKKYSIEATPTIVINEKKLEGSTSYKNIKKKIEKLI